MASSNRGSWSSLRYSYLPSDYYRGAEVLLAHALKDKLFEQLKVSGVSLGGVVNIDGKETTMLVECVHVSKVTEAGKAFLKRFSIGEDIA